MANVSVIGAGSWGTALSCVLNSNGHQVTIWSALEDEIDMLIEKREHLWKLPGVKISTNISFTKDLKDAVKEKDVIVLAVPSVYTRTMAKQIQPFVSSSQIIVNVAKGIEEKSLMTLAEIINDEIHEANVVVLSGPSHAEEVGKGLPTTCVAGAADKKTAEAIQNLFMNEYFRVYTSPDVMGIELGGALKNVIALAAGMADGLGFGDNTKAALITRGINEISRLAITMGAKAETLSGLTGIGDLIVTCASLHSRNRRAGMLIGEGKTREEAMQEVNMVVEGVYSAKAALGLAEKHQVSMPIIEQVNAVLFQDKSVKEAVTELMLRDKKMEHDDLLWK